MHARTTRLKYRGTKMGKKSNKFVFLKPHINVKKGALNFGIRSDIKLGGFETKSSNNTSVGAGGYKHKESSSSNIMGILRTSDSKNETANFNRHSTSEAHSSSFAGISRSSDTHSKTTTWTDKRESKSHQESVAGIYKVNAEQHTSTGLHGYQNQWSYEKKVGGISSSASHSVGVGRGGTHFTDTVNMGVNHTPLVNVSAPAVLLGGTNPYFAQSAASISHEKRDYPRPSYTYRSASIRDDHYREPVRDVSSPGYIARLCRFFSCGCVRRDSNNLVPVAEVVCTPMEL